TLPRHPNSHHYTTPPLDRNTSKLLGVNMMINNMIKRAFLSPDEKESDYSITKAPIINHP
ncbi:hypothetical protein LW953_17610, partial [Erwinia amylovora]|nr:hypothetical protein [Erwinia amylovora]